ncbi:putative membrane skeletal protein [Gregarina niphandrodes]|uniref:Membrane skeletal protein n=1 Tax=Gregarina niphandrodes TaxID=110365 RepID=A0A023B698_GRENI|nr:putative membrane skeletal protein [Gregarina niphandrodes]EZG65910.1 putative membrane skeletal protein [Gregarina niphandrodes]|eukprot:XP_011134033.1 putative membrane skeletal protein [Gregarina niphandrodes]
MGTRQASEQEFVAVPRDVHVTERVQGVPVTRQIEEIEPQFREQTIVRAIPTEKVVYHDRKTPVVHRRIVDEYVETPVERGVTTTFVPRITVQEREIEVPVPRIVWKERVQEVPEVREIVRYVDTEDNVERVIRYIPDTPNMNLSPAASPGMPDEDDESLEGVVLPKQRKFQPPDAPAPVTIDIPVPFMVPKPLCISIDVPMIRFRDHFVPVPVRRHVTPKLSFNENSYDVPCVREKPVLIVKDQMKPVPVDVHIRVQEKDIQVDPIDAQDLSQADYHAMWMRLAADQLDAFRAAHGGKYPRGMHVPEDMKTATRTRKAKAKKARKG